VTNVMRNSKGFSLIEVLTAIAILIISMLGVLNTMVVAIDHNLSNILRDEAVSIAQQQMSELRNQAFDSLSNGSTSVTRNFRKLTKTFTVQWTASSLSTNSIAMQVVVSWTFKGLGHQHSITSVISTDI
jgi:type IV pilus assembly protein PilV